MDELILHKCLWCLWCFCGLLIGINLGDITSRFLETRDWDYHIIWVMTLMYIFYRIGY